MNRYGGGPVIVNRLVPGPAVWNGSGLIRLVMVWAPFSPARAGSGREEGSGRVKRWGSAGTCSHPGGARLIIVQRA